MSPWRLRRPAGDPTMMARGEKGDRGPKGDTGSAPATSATLEKQGRRNVIAYVGLLLCVVIALASSFRTQAHLKATQNELLATQHALAVSQKKSTETRIVTVTQRCQLTKLILDVLVRQDPVVAGAFQASYAGCEKQLAEVKSINAHAP
jgi:hypothetical protein